MEITSPTGWAATYNVADEHGRVLRHRRAVESFSDDGEALVMNTQRGCLVSARALDGFAGVEECTRPPVAVLPAQPGYRVVGPNGDGTEWSEPVVAWVITDATIGYPMIPHWDEGTVEVHGGGFEDVRLRGPDGQGTPYSK